MLTLLTDLNGFLLGFDEFLVDFFGLDLDFGEHINKLFIIEQVTIGVGKSLKK